MKKKNISIQKKLITCMVAVLLVLSGILILISTFFIYNSNMKTLDNSIHATLTSTSSLIERTLYTLKNNVQNVALMETISDKNASKEEKLNVMNQIREKNSYDEVGFVELNGQGYSNYGEFDFNDQFHFQAAKKGELFVGEPIINRLNGKVILISGAPVYSDDKIIGTVYIVDMVESVNDKIASISFGKSGYAYVINQDGKIIYHKDKQKVADEINPIELAKSDKSYRSYANAIQTILSKKDSSTISYRMDGKSMYAAYCPVEGYEQWYLVMTAPKIEFLSSIFVSFVVNILISCILLSISIYIIVRILKQFTLPIHTITEKLLRFSEGNLNQEIDVLDTGDELGTLSMSLKNMAENLNNYIMDIARVLGEISKGNLKVDTSADFKGDFVTIEKALKHIITSLNDTLKQISDASDHVAINASYVSEGSRNLAENTTEEASVVEQLSASVAEITDKVAKTAENAQKANISSDETRDEMILCNTKMQQMIESMKEMKEASNEIYKILNNMEDIASETNLLSFNAAIEAARAGEAGKSFSIVAKQIGTLANQSSLAAKNTADLIGKSMEAVEKGTSIANMTAQSLANVLEKVKGVTDLISDISNAANDQKNSIDLINIGVEQMASSIESNSTTAEESATISFELSNQAQMLKERIEQFKLEA